LEGRISEKRDNKRPGDLSAGDQSGVTLTEEARGGNFHGERRARKAYGRNLMEMAEREKENGETRTIQKKPVRH